MSRSYKKNPICGNTCATSECFDKMFWHRKWRLREKVKLSKTIHKDVNEHYTVHYREVSDVWLMHKDGKQRLRFDKAKNPLQIELYRKALKK